MKIEPPLSNLIARCQTICVAECCGIDAYDFSPVQIASYLTMWRGSTDPNEVTRLRQQIEDFRDRYGSRGSGAGGVTIEEMNQSFTKEAIDGLGTELCANLVVALELIAISESNRYHQAEHVSSDGHKPSSHVPSDNPTAPADAH